MDKLVYIASGFLFAFFFEGENFEAFQHPKIKERELFLAFNKDTHPASLLR